MVLKINDLVEVCTDKFTGFGEIRWMGIIPEKSRDEAMVGIVMTEFYKKDTNPPPPDGFAHGKKYFTSPPTQGIFAHRQQVSKLDKYPLGGLKLLSEIFLPRPMCTTNVGAVYNETKGVAGISGYKNSSYMDCTLLCMFAFRTEYDPPLCRRLSKVDKNNITAQSHLRNVVRKIRTSLKVPGQDIMLLRKVMDLYDRPNTWSATEMDPCQLVEKLFTAILKQKRFLEMSISLKTGQDQLVGEEWYLTINSALAPEWKVPTLQDLFEATIAHNNGLLDEIPKHLILAIPQAEYRKHGAIHPCFDLDITNILRAHPKQCGMCGTCALYQCKDCYLKFGNDLSTTYFCQNCHAQCHDGLGIKHSVRRVMANQGYRGDFSSRVVMELTALLCRKGDHYVAYGKCDPPLEYETYTSGDWFFFDSMHEIQGDEEGKPFMKHCDLDSFKESAPAYHLDVLKHLDGKGNLDDKTANFFQNCYLAFFNRPRFLYF